MQPTAGPQQVRRVLAFINTFGPCEAGGGLPLLPTVRDFAKQLLMALRLLSRAQLIHADVKPENLLLASDNVSIKLCDFGTCHGPQDLIKSDAEIRN